MSRRTLGLLTTLAALACAETPTAAGPATALPGPRLSNVGVYTTVKIERIDMGIGAASAINDNGVATGYTNTPGSGTGDKVFRWTKAGGMQDVGVTGKGYDINLAEVIVGTANEHAFYRWSNGTFVDLGTLGGNDSDAFGINDSGRVAGRADAPTKVHAFRWKPTTALQDIHNLAAPYLHSGGHGINKAGHVVGWVQNDFVKYGFLWTSTEGMSLLPSLGGNWTIAHDINDAGVVVGESQLYWPGGPQHAFRWSAADGLTDLGSPGWVESRALGINKNGYIAGRADDLGPTLWRPNGKRVALGSLPGGSGGVAEDVNKHLEIVGRGWGADGFQHAIYWKVTFYNFVLSDVQPGAVPNTVIQGAGGSIDVAILTTADFDATAIDAAGLTLGDDRGADTPIARDASGRVLASRVDANGDGRLDLVARFDQAALERNGDLTLATRELIIAADLGEGQGIRGVDEVRVLPRE